MKSFSLILLLLLVGPFVRAEEPVPPHAVVFMYHHVSEATPPSTSVSPASFRAHLEYLDENGFRVRPLAEIVAALAGEQALPDSVVAITFDDGYRSVYETAYPLLREKGWPFTVFVSSEAIDGGHGPVMTWEQLREMGENGAAIASHGRHHHHLQRLRGGESRADWAARLKADLQHSLDRMKAETGQENRMLAYPFGESDQPLRDLVADMGWVGFGQQSGAMGELSDRSCLPRFPMATGFDQPEDFALKAASLPLPVTGVRAEDLLLRFSEESVIIGAEPPGLQLRLEAGFSGLTAYASGQGQALVRPLDGQDGAVEITARRPLPPGRSRYNVTAPFGSGGRWYWYSYTWIVGQAHDD